MPAVNLQRSTGLSPAVGKLKNKDLKQLAVTYLELGEWVCTFRLLVVSVLSRPLLP